MGRGSKTHEVGVKKEPIGGHSQVGGSSNKKQTDSCLFSFNVSIPCTPAQAAGIKESASVVLVPHHTRTSSLEILIDGKNFGFYSGKNLERMLSCISLGFVYEGIVNSVSNSSIKLKISGR